MIQAIHDEITFDFEKNYEQLIKRFRHMSLFSVCLHFLRCRRSCEKKAGYYKFCSRVRENCFYDLDKFSNLIVPSEVDDFLNICSAERLRLNRLAYFQYPNYDLINGKCCHLEVFSFARDLFAAFSAVFVRMYLSYTIDHFSDLTSHLSLGDERKLF